jgi:hypothetical protein
MKIWASGDENIGFFLWPYGCTCNYTFTLSCTVSCSISIGGGATLADMCIG